MSKEVNFIDIIKKIRKGKTFNASKQQFNMLSSLNSRFKKNSEQLDGKNLNNNYEQTYNKPDSKKSQQIKIMSNNNFLDFLELI